MIYVKIVEGKSDNGDEILTFLADSLFNNFLILLINEF